MRVKTWVETSQEIEVDVSMAEVMSSIGELIESDQPAMVGECVQRAWSVLHHLSDDQINLLSPAARTTISVALRLQATRYAPPDPGTGPFNAIASECRRTAMSKGWNCLTPADWEDAYRIPAVLALIHSEVSEALEAFRIGDHKHVGEELADVVIRCLDMTAGLEIDLDSEVAAKMLKNQGRSYRHGGKKL